MRPLTTRDVPVPSWLDLSQAPARLKAAVVDAVALDRGKYGDEAFLTATFAKCWYLRFGYHTTPPLSACETVLSNLPYVSLKSTDRWVYNPAYPHQPPAIIQMSALAFLNPGQTAILGAVREQHRLGLVLGPPATKPGDPAPVPAPASVIPPNFLANADKLVAFLEPIVKQAETFLPLNVDVWAVVIDQAMLAFEKLNPAPAP